MSEGLFKFYFSILMIKPDALVGKQDLQDTDLKLFGQQVLEKRMYPPTVQCEVLIFKQLKLVSCIVQFVQILIFMLFDLSMAVRHVLKFSRYVYVCVRFFQFCQHFLYYMLLLHYQMYVLWKLLQPTVIIVTNVIINIYYYIVLISGNTFCHKV